MSSIGSLSRDSVYNNTSLRSVYSGMLKSYGVIVSKVKKMEEVGTRRKIGFVVVCSDGNVVYFGPPDDGDIPSWVSNIVNYSGVRLVEEFSLSEVARNIVKEVVSGSSRFEIVNLCVGANASSSGGRIYPGPFSSSFGEGIELIGTVCAHDLKDGKAKPPIVYLSDGRVSVKWGCRGMSHKDRDEVRKRVKKILKVKAGWVWKDISVSF